MRRWLQCGVLLLLCAVGIRAQQPVPNGYIFGVYVNTNNTGLLATNIWWTNYGVATQQLWSNALPTNVVAISSTSSQAPLTNLNLYGQKNVSFFIEAQAWTNVGGPTAGFPSNLVVQFDISPDYYWWQMWNPAYVSNALWITDPNYILNLSVSSNAAGNTTGWTNSAWTNFTTTGFSTMRVHSFQNTSTNLVVSNIWLEYFFKSN